MQVSVYISAQNVHKSVKISSVTRVVNTLRQRRDEFVDHKYGDGGPVLLRGTESCGNAV